MLCKRCNEPIVDKRKTAKYCSPTCSRLDAKARYRARKKDHINEYAKEYRKKNRAKIRVYNTNHARLATGRYQINDGDRERLVSIQGCCARCDSTDELQAAHFKPHWAGGGNNLDNFVLFCASCHVQFDKATRNFWQGFYTPPDTNRVLEDEIKLRGKHLKSRQF